MWLLGLVLLSTAWAEKLDQAIYLPPGASAAGGSPGELAAPHPGGVPVTAPEVIPILSYNNQPSNGDGTYSFNYETGNGIKAQEEGVLKNEVPEGPGEAVRGAYEYTGPDGVLYTVTYTADENGFVVQGAHLPTPPPVPPEIQAALEQNAAEEAAQTTPVPGSYFRNYPHSVDTNHLYNRYHRRFYQY